MYPDLKLLKVQLRERRIHLITTVTGRKQSGLRNLLELGGKSGMGIRTSHV